MKALYYHLQTIRISYEFTYLLTCEFNKTMKAIYCHLQTVKIALQLDKPYINKMNYQQFNTNDEVLPSALLNTIGPAAMLLHLLLDCEI